MSEGGLFPWKVQKIRSKPVADYSRMSLPPPPFGQRWQQDLQTKEYKLVPVVVPPSPTQVVVDFSEQSCSNGADDWELLSDGAVAIESQNNKASGDNTNAGSSCSGSHHTRDALVFVARAGSVRSIDTLDESHNSNNYNIVGGCGPSSKIQRTHSNSTIDSNDVDGSSSSVLGPSGKGVLGVDYLEHVILPTDTLQGICIAYKISSTRLRQANHFSGNSLLLAPKKLVIPISKQALKSGFIRVQDTDAKEYKIYYFLAEFQNLFGVSEAKAYLELADWDMKSAIKSAKEDIEWEREMDGDVGKSTSSAQKLKSGEIRITASSSGDIRTLKGAGICFLRRRISPTCISLDEDDYDAGAAPLPNPKQPVVHRTAPAIATKTVQPQDVYRAAVTEHDNYGVELKDISKTSSFS